MAPLKVMFCHGVSHFEKGGAGWFKPLLPTLETAFQGSAASVGFSFFEYDKLFESDPVTLDQYAGAFVRMGTSWIFGELRDLVLGRRGLKDVPDMIRWTAGMVAQWDQDGGLQKQLRDAFYEQVAAADPDIVVGHSMGSLIAYDALTEVVRPDGLPRFKFLTIGSQIGHPAVRNGGMAGRLPMPYQVESWLHVWNPGDIVFTSRIDSPASPPVAEFRQMIVPPESRKGLLANHAIETYLLEPSVQTYLPTWVSMPRGDVRTVLSRDSEWGKGKAKSRVYVQDKTTPEQVSKGLATPRNRALLVGINQYADPKNTLQGCVNDVFEMSACLQESGLAADEIRVVLDQRATTEGILERIEWLLDDVRDGDVRVLYFSGHGARVPVYGLDGVPATVVETLVTHDTDWGSNLGVTDFQLSSLYAQLPYDAQLLVLLDCCHSGGMTRDGQRLVRSFDPPDDVRHRSLRWDKEARMWADRPPADTRAGNILGGPLPELTRLGESRVLRPSNRKRYVAVRERKGHLGPYQPLVIAACKDTEFAFEYRHGVTSYGAFTFALTSTLRDVRSTATGTLTYTDLMTRVGKKLKSLRYDQTPNMTGPDVRKEGVVPNGIA